MHGRRDAGGRDDGMRGRSGGRRIAVSEDATQKTMAVAVAMATVSVGCTSAASGGHAKGLALGVLVCVLFAVVELLLEGPSLLLVGKRQAGEAVLELKRVEEDAILVVGEGVVDFLVPDDAAGVRLPLSAGAWSAQVVYVPKCRPS